MLWKRKCPGSIRTPKRLASMCGRSGIRRPLELPSVIHASTVAGDAVHNIRSALDYLVWDLVANAGVAKPGRHTNFPIFDKKEDFARTPCVSGPVASPPCMG